MSIIYFFFKKTDNYSRCRENIKENERLQKGLQHDRPLLSNPRNGGKETTERCSVYTTGKASRKPAKTDY